MAMISVWPVGSVSCEFETGDTVESGFICSGHRGFCRDCVERLFPSKVGGGVSLLLCFNNMEVHEINTGPS